jgi:hypothetical protein
MFCSIGHSASNLKFDIWGLQVVKVGKVVRVSELPHFLPGISL